MFKKIHFGMTFEYFLNLKTNWMKLEINLKTKHN